MAQHLIVPGTAVTAEGPVSLMCEKLSPMYDMTPLDSPRNTGLYRSRNWAADRVLFADAFNEAVAVRRTKAQAENGAGLVFVHRYLNDGIRGVMGEINIDRDPGHIYLMDQESRVECLQFPNRVQGVFIPKDMIGYRSGDHAPFIRFSDNRVVGALLFQEFDRLFDELFSRDVIEHETFNRFLACVKVAISSDQRDGDVRRQARAALADLIRQYIEQNLDQPDLSSSLLLKNFGVSRSSLFRMFEAEGGVRRFINQRRVYRAVLEISRRPGTRGAISQAAYRWGFSSGANFNRAVRDQFGVSPGSLVRLPAPDRRFPGAGADIYEFAQRA